MKIKELQEELATVVAKYRALDVEYEGKSKPADVLTQQGNLHERGMKIKELLESEMAITTRGSDMDALSNYLDKPMYRAGHDFNPANNERDNIKALVAKGWESKNGLLYAPTSLGIHVEMFPEEVLFGDLPEEPNAVEYFKTTRSAMKPEYRSSYMKMMRLTAKMGSSAAWVTLTGAEQKALSEGQDSTGGFLVPPDTQSEILVRLAAFSIMRRKARIVNTSRDRVTFPAVAPNATNGSIYSSGFVGGWAGETPAFADTDPSWQMFEIGIKKVRVATKLSNDWIADAVSDPLAFLARNGAENMALVEDQGFIAGDGGSLQPLGLLNSGITTVDVEGSTANLVINTSSAQGSAPKLIDLVYAVPAQYVSNAEWIMCRSIEGKVRKLVDAQNRYMWPMGAGSMFAGPNGDPRSQRTLMDYPVNNSEFVPNDGTDANKVFVYGDLSQYFIAQRAQITSVVLRERFADSDQTGIILFERVGGGLWNTDALRIGIV